jgi:hypothetical protein
MFDWNQSPLTKAAERERAARDGVMRARRAAAKAERPRIIDHGTSDEVKKACRAWLKGRGLEVEFAPFVDFRAINKRKAAASREAS